MDLGPALHIYEAQWVLPLHGEEVWTAMVRLRRSELWQKVRDLIHCAPGMLFGKKKLPEIFYYHVLMLYFIIIIKIMKMKKTTSRSSNTTARRTKSTYVPVTRNIYFDGSAYRVRVSVNGSLISKTFTNKRTAITFRNQLLKTAA